MSLVDPAIAARYRAEGWWSDDALADHVRRHAEARPDADAFVTDDARVSWATYWSAACSLASQLASLGLPRLARVGVALPDDALVHIGFLATELAGVTAVAIGARSRPREAGGLLARTGAVALVTHDPSSVDELRALAPSIEHVLVVDAIDAVQASEPSFDDTLRLGPDELFLLNSTSGTTGLPKRVQQTQNRWWYFHQQAVEAGALSPDDVCMSAIPAQFGFGLWTAHFTPSYLGAPCVLTPRFDPELALRLIERERVTMLACVSTQFIMMLNSPVLESVDLSSLRVMFTGGEAVPYERAAAFEERTGAAVLQFYGSNESGALSRTRLTDTRDQRLRTAGQIIPDMEVALLDDDGVDITESGVPGVPVCRGPATSPGYDDDPAANELLFTPDGRMRMGDIVTIDADGYLRVVGRTSDFIIRGGKNVSAAVVEEAVGAVPGVRLVAAVAWPDPVFGERVAVYVAAAADAEVTLEAIAADLDRRGVSKELWPERLVVLDDLPRAPGGKIAKSELKADADRRAAADAENA